MREEALLQVEPYALDRVQLRRVGRQRHERDVVRHNERARAMPAGLVEHQGDVLIFRDRLCEAIEELLHRLGVHVRHDQGKRIVGAGLDGREDVGEREALVAQARRALASLPPDVCRAPLLSDPRFVLEEQADALVFMRPLNSSQKSRGSF